MLAHEPWRARARGEALRLVVAGAALSLVLAAIGWAVVALAPDGTALPWEAGFIDALVAQRTPERDTWTRVGSGLSDTVTCIVVASIAFTAFRLWLLRWRESWTVVAAILGELLVFLVVTALVERGRPDVEHLDVSPPTSSFPSGHVAAAVALYGCIAVLLVRNLGRPALAWSIAVALALIPFVVAFSRMYRGMHFPTDVVFGFLGGGTWLLIVLLVLRPTSPPGRQRDDPIDRGSDLGEQVATPRSHALEGEG